MQISTKLGPNRKLRIIKQSAMKEMSHYSFRLQIKHRDKLNVCCTCIKHKHIQKIHY